MPRKTTTTSLSLLPAVLFTLSCGDVRQPVEPVMTGATRVGIPSGAQAAANRDPIAEIDFGRLNTGTAFPAPSGHDRSFHSYDKIVPRTVIIPVGGQVRLNTGVFHQAAIYDVGTRPDDIVLSPATLDDVAVPFPPFTLPDFLIDDPAGRLALSPVFFAPTTWLSPAVFDTPGTYLIICTVLPHFVDAKMYAYVIVQ